MGLKNSCEGKTFFETHRQKNIFIGLDSSDQKTCYFSKYISHELSTSKLHFSFARRFVADLKKKKPSFLPPKNDPNQERGV